MESTKDTQAYLNTGFVPDDDGDWNSQPKDAKAAEAASSTERLTTKYAAITLGDDRTTAAEKAEETVAEEEEKDPWALPELKSTDIPWGGLSATGKARRVALYSVKFTCLIGLLYMFICSLDILSSAFRLLGGKAAGEALSNTVLFENPIAGMMLGVLVTVLVQSSSTSTSIVVSMVSADLLEVYMAIPMVMGANIGTTVTNTIVAIGQSTDRGDFRRAFAAATVHDMFNWLCVLVFLPLEWASRYLFYLTDAIVKDLPDGYSNSTTENPEFLKAITKPLTDKVVKLSTEKIRDIAQGKDINGSLLTGDDHLFSDWTASDAAAGGILLAVSLLVLCACLVLIVKLLTSLLKGTIATLLQRFMNSDLPGPFRHLTGYLAILVGAGLTILVQSSSIFTSALTPLVGVGAIHIERMYPLTLGSNIGTTVTGILAALASDPTGFKNSFQVALCHLFFNISGILLWFPIPVLRKVPINMAKMMGQTVFKYRWFSVFYLIFVYFLLPVAVFGLSMAGWEALFGVVVPVIILVVVVIIINVLQTKKPHLLPARLSSWKALGVPEPLRSLEPYDRIIKRVGSCCMCCRKKEETDDTAADTAAAGAAELGAGGKVGKDQGQGQTNGISNGLKSEQNGGPMQNTKL